MAVEVETEFGFYHGDCYWAAVHMALHNKNPQAWPLTLDILNALTQAAIAAGIGVGPNGEATAEQVVTMLDRWGIGHGDPMGVGNRAALVTYLDDHVSAPTFQPVLVNFSNGGALYVPPTTLQGHAVVVIHPYDGPNDGYVCGDGNNPRCAHGLPAYYNADVLMAAQPVTLIPITSAPPVPGISAASVVDVVAIRAAVEQILKLIGG